MTDFAAESAAPAESGGAAATTEATSAPEVTVTPTPKPKPIFFSRFSMRAPLVVNGQARPDVESVMMFGIYRENPRIVVKTNDPADEANNYGKVTAAMDPLTCGVLIGYLEDLIKNPVKDVKVVDNFNLYKGGQKFDEPQFINRTLVGRDEDGRIWLKVVEEGRPAPTFFFGPPKFHALIRMDKTPVPAAEASQRYATSFCRLMMDVMTTSMGKRDDGEEDAASMNKPAQERPEQRQGGGGNWGNRQGGGGNWQGRQGGGGNWGNRGGGGGWQGRGGGGGGNWQNRGGGAGGGNWGNRQGGGGGNWQNRGGGNGGGQQSANVSNDEITF